VYFAANDMLTSAIAKYERLIIEVPTSAERSLYRAESLHAERELELLRNKRRAFLDDLAAINPPSQPTVEKAIALTEKLAATAAAQAKGQAIIDMVAKGLEAFAKIQAA
jgi:fructose-specific component phosphotransferase system IIB-like protein